MPRAYRIKPSELGGSTIDYSELPPAASGVGPGAAYPTRTPIPPSGDVYGAPRAPYTPPAATPAPTPAPSYPDLSGASMVGADYFPSSVGYPDLSNAPPVQVQPSSPNLVAPENQPLPAVQQLLFGNFQRNQGVAGADQNAMAPDWASNARGTFGRGPNYVDPRAANAFFAGLVNWNAGGWAANPTGGEFEGGLFGRGPTTAQGLARAAILRGGGIGAVPGMAAKIT